MEKSRKEIIKEKLTFKYRFVVLNEDTFEERFSFKLNRLNAFIFGGIFSVLLISLTILFITLTPLKEYIQGYSSTELQKETTDLVYKVDSLNQALSVNDLYIENIQQVLKGEIKRVTFNKDSVLRQFQIDEIDFAPSPVDSMFREEVEQMDRFSVFQQAKKSTDIVFSTPIKGQITQQYDDQEKHFAVDIAVDQDTPVKAIADGTVIFRGFTADTGYVIVIEHGQGFTSIYKHNSSIYKEQGELVKSGEAIASAGSTGAFSTGAHLHFELWNDGYPVNPTNYINFD
ncbi:M23 family metallopeptidase [Lutimonas halocynthiae]|uniref:M23 family metallopeptidase n=1 Tax=Lutimonas halocynthiae TaxID=1446477 RepID=UPI0025B3AEC3|nr:M23 family metallopeptidase [Lutimonas halocynthiae]MDN3641358.1 M23 family metallopeptidase [Lutimonas halocynthiae]